MAWFRIELTEVERQIVREEQESHPNSHVRQRMLALWLLHCGITREQSSRPAATDSSAGRCEPAQFAGKG